MDFIGNKIGYSKRYNVLGCTFDYPQFTIVICYQPSGKLDSVDVIMDDDYIED